MVFLDQIGGVTELCDEVAPVLRIVGIVYVALLIVIPILLIMMGMVDFTKAVSEKNDDKIKEAQKKLVSRAVAAVIAVLVIVLVGLIMRIVGNTQYKDCIYCVTNPFGEACNNAVSAVNAEYDLGK